MKRWPTLQMANRIRTVRETAVEAELVGRLSCLAAYAATRANAGAPGRMNVASYHNTITLLRCSDVTVLVCSIACGPVQKGRPMPTHDDEAPLRRAIVVAVVARAKSNHPF